MKRGIVYLAWGQCDVGLLRRSVESVRKYSDLPVWLFSDEPHADLTDLFDQIRVDLVPPCNLLTKANIYDLSPFEETCYLDTDTVLLQSIESAWQHVSLHKIALCIAPAFYFGNYYAVQGLSGLEPYCDITVYNTGVIFFAKAPSIEGVFASWKKHNQENSFRCDQPGLAMAIRDTNINPYVLPRTWNYRSSNRHVPLYRDGHGPIIIWHNRKPPPADPSFADVVSPWSLDTVVKKKDVSMRAS